MRRTDCAGIPGDGYAGCGAIEYLDHQLAAQGGPSHQSGALFFNLEAPVFRVERSFGRHTLSSLADLRPQLLDPRRWCHSVSTQPARRFSSTGARTREGPARKASTPPGCCGVSTLTWNDAWPRASVGPITFVSLSMVVVKSLACICRNSTVILTSNNTLSPS
jgi:hypothetical protein